ncbi:16S rRNA (cytosine(1402)-N(4))-methyltransferase RsmH [Brachybacterium sp. EF45031]|uniref:16S rRNA (cytosine(1402)-N(4))-methyltransferase RsmH n=1 Tax=Brachybacterium sillae TaxID=2810536 RepID=UPI00217EF94F|nr:16S rRNA (cytosine(1402)-N(4))-methyltransferase RsmH [Brachybacterium sillae]MCS6712395.1 16S rRNA (cytosine(1402)-N(4))-methyltransferase RsmH [Brachybacterium sillae]
MPHSLPAEQRHLPVLRDRCVELLLPALQHDGAVYVDGTLGMGGHATAILDAAPQARLVGIDRDAQALDLARERLQRAGHGDRITLVHATYDRIPEVLDDLGLPGAAAILLDLGLSSFQIDTDERGFSYAVDAPLDMRMDPDSGGPTAADLLADLPEEEIARILHDLGDERHARRIARAVVRTRQAAPLTRSAQLVDLIEQAVPAVARHRGGHPAKRSFQALRIAVNRELEILVDALEGALDALLPGGRLAVESYHSGEDRLVKTAFHRRTTSSAPPGLPVELEEHRPRFAALTRGAEKADDAELARNPRAASVRLRAVERLSIPS